MFGKLWQYACSLFKRARCFSKGVSYSSNPMRRYLETDLIARQSTAGKLGKYLVRADKAKALWTHWVLAPKALASAKARATLVVGNYEYNLLHFRDRDWEDMDDNNSRYANTGAWRFNTRLIVRGVTLPVWPLLFGSQVRKFKITAPIAKHVAKALWERYVQIPNSPHH